jgi:uncharacterized protein (DUF1697 family)
MAALRSGLTEFGCTDVATYIQSGNVVLTPPAVDAPLDAWLSERIGEIAGFAVPTVTRTAAEIDAVVAGNPYPSASGTQLHVVFFGEAPPSAVFDAVDPASVAPEEWMLAGRDLYLHLPNGMGRASLPVALEKAGRKVKGPPGTSRNWNTVRKVQAMLHG